MNMQKWINDTIKSPVKAPMPILSFPCVQLSGCSVKELVYSSELQAKGMKLVADRIPSAASVSLMDLSVEAEAFGSVIHVSDDEVPTVTGAVVTEMADAEKLPVPKVGDARTGIYVDAIRQAKELISDRPVFAGIIGPYSLAGRLMDVTEIMMLCYDDPDMVHIVLDKATRFLISYAEAFKNSGADGIVIAEPLAGLLSPKLAAEFSHSYVKKLVEAVQTDDFIVIYHNCGNTVPLMAKEIYAIGASGYHFGDAIKLSDMLTDAPDTALVMGNVSPSAQFLGGTPESIREATLEVMRECCHKPNFVISSGCDIPPLAKWENIDSFFAAAKDFYNA